MRFSIRDLLWATALVAVGLGWWVSYRAADAKRLEAVEQAQRLHSGFSYAKKWHESTSNFPSVDWAIFKHPPDWTQLDEPLVEP